LPTTVVASARRLVEHGVWRMTVLIQLLKLQYLLGVDPERIRHRYAIVMKPAPAAGGGDCRLRPTDGTNRQVEPGQSGSSRSFPVVWRPCRSRCACAASASEYRPPMVIRNDPAEIASKTSAARQRSSSRVAT
jgi:hypothetical protein